MIDFFPRCLIFCGFLVISASEQCTINPPFLVKKYGSRKIVLQDQSKLTRLQSGETINAYCSTKLTHPWNPAYFKNIKASSVDLICDQKTTLFYKTHKDEDQIITAGLCYNLDALQLKFLNYLAYRRKHELFSAKPSSVDLRTVSLDKELENLDSFYTFMSGSNFVEAYDRKKLDYPLLDLHAFNYESLIQDAPLRGNLKDFENMLNIVWWRNLRLGNWANFLKALHARSSNVRYRLYTGTSGVIWMPTSSCNKSEILSVAHGEITVSAPEYIWSYVEAVSGNITEEFVVVGNNSPFFNNEPETMLCKDMCEDIEWL